MFSLSANPTKRGKGSIYGNREADFGLLWPLRFFQFSNLLRAHYVQLKWMGVCYNAAH